jgi:hypothetical protein
MQLQNASGCHIRMPHQDATSGCHPHQDATSGCHIRMPHQDATSGCHIRMPHQDATSGCHISDHQSPFIKILKQQVFIVDGISL